MAAHPAHTVWNGGRRVGAAGCIPSPRHELRLDLVYAASYGPIMVLGVLGMVWTRRCWCEHSLIHAAFLDCVVVTAMFFGHTSHRSYLDVYWIAYAAAHVVWPPDWVR
jgi:hypothetical protein